MYNASHGELVDGYNYEESQKIIWDLLDWATQDKYVFTMNWESPGDMIMVSPLADPSRAYANMWQWDNRIVMHRATSNWDNKHLRRDMRRTSNFDTGPGAWGPDDIGKPKEVEATNA